MNTTLWRLGLLSGIDAVGNWVVYLALALHISHTYGAEYVALFLLAKSVPFIVFPKFFANRIPQKYLYKAFIFSKLGKAALMFSLLAGYPLWALLLVEFLEGTLGGVSNPCMQQLQAQWLSEKAYQSAMSKLASVRTVLMSASPLLGGWIADTFSLKAVFVVNGISFILVCMCVLPQPKTMNPKIVVKEKPKTFSSEKCLTPVLFWACMLWYAHLCMGALFNGVEFALFKWNEFTTMESSFMFFAWGMGGVFILLLPSAWLSKIPWKISAFVWIVMHLAFFIPGFYSVAITFCVGAFTGNLMNGALAKIQIKHLPQGYTLSSLSALSASRLGIINVGFYLFTFLGLKQLSKESFLAIMGVLAVFALYALFKLGKALKGEENKPASIPAQ